MILPFFCIFLLWNLCGAELSEVFQPNTLETVKVGDLATIHCYIMSTMWKRVWYKLTAARKLEFVAMLDARYNRSIFADEFSQRYSANFDSANNHLVISPVSVDDSGTFFCGVMQLNNIRFGSGTHLLPKGVDVTGGSVVQLPELQSVQFGDSVTLTCSVHSGKCAIEHNDIKWLKKSNLLAVEMMKFLKNDKTTCQWSESGETLCMYDLLRSNLSSEDAGTYYCVVTSCGQTWFGSGTKVTFESDDMEIPVTSVPLSISSQIIIFCLFLPLLGCMIATGIWCLSTGSPACCTSCAEGRHTAHVKIKRPERRDDTWTECVYFSVTQYN